MKVIFLLESGLALNIPGPTRVLNIKKILDKHHSTGIICKKIYTPLEIITGISTIRANDNSFIRRQLLKLRIIFRASYLMASDKVDFIVARNYYYIIFLRPMAWLRGTRLIYDMHCFRYLELISERKPLKSILVRPIEKITHLLADNIVTISPGMAMDLSEHLRQKSITLPNGVNLDEFANIRKNKSYLSNYNLSKSDKIVGFLGNIIDWVDLDTMLTSSRIFPPGRKLMIVGDYSKVQNIDEMKARYPDVIFTGQVPHEQAISLLAAMDVVLLPYKNDAILRHLSLRKTTEYLAAGKPIVMSNSDLSESSMLKERVNALVYRKGDPGDLARKVRSMLADKAGMRRMSSNNVKLAATLDWEHQVMNSGLFKIIKNYPVEKTSLKFSGRITIIIKALNEEKYIAECIKSAVKALKGFQGEIILVDSKSTDNTVRIAKRYPIKIIQLKHEKDRCCGIGPQIGYMLSNGDFIYILDGDMKLDRNFIRNALPYFDDKRLAGVGGNIFETSRENLAFQSRSKYNFVNNVTQVDQLGMGGIYRRNAILDVGYFSNPYLEAYEEYDLGAKLKSKGYYLLRLPVKMVDHHGDETTSIQTLKNRWKSGYLFGSGQYLRSSIGYNFLITIKDLKLYIITLFWWLFGFIAIGTYSRNMIPFVVFLSMTILISILLLIKKKRINRLIFSLMSWTIQSAGMVVGFLKMNRSPFDFKPEVNKIK